MATLGDSFLLQLLGPEGAGAASHPFWVLDWSELVGPAVIVCTFVLLLSGILCSAGGIGGGGIYVTVLMVAGGLSARDAIPLSKSIVFFGSVSSLILNLGKTVSKTSTESLIDYNLCRLVVPAALLGTLMGVFLNHNAPDWILITILCIVLLFMSYMTIRTAVNQYLEEEAAEKPVDAALTQEEGSAEATRLAPTDLRLPSQESNSTPPEARPDPGYGSLDSGACHKKSVDTSLTRCESLLCVAALVTVIGCGVFRFHAENCQVAVQKQKFVAETCHHPAVWLIGDSLEAWMQGPAGSLALFVSIAFPIGTFAAVMIYYSRFCMVDHSWTPADVLKYQSMGLGTGCLAGLVGIGGGLIFSPFFLLMGVNPAVAVATSSTCVIFTSSSTTMQYLLTDRIMISLTIVYGLTNLFASYLGTSLVHQLQDRFAARKSYITSIVAVGVLISAALSIIKFFDQNTPTPANAGYAWMQKH